MGIPGSSQIQPLASLVGSDSIQPWATLAADQQNLIQRAIAPEAAITEIVYPNSQTELAAMIAWARQQRWSVLPCGAGSKLDWGGLCGQPGVPLAVVSTARLHRLIDHAVGDLTVTVEAGMRFADLQATLASAGQFLAIDPAYPEQAAIGGIVATADTGSLRQRYNGVRDMLLGLTLVRSDGQTAKAGGRVVKNVAGYDLMKLFTGSYGTLGIITQVTFRVYPLPAATQTVVLSGAAAAIAQARATLLRSALTPTSLDLLPAPTAQALNLPAAMTIVVRFQSTAASVQQQVNRTLELGQALGLSGAIHPDEAVWTQLRQLIQDRSTITCKMGMKPATAVAFLQQIDSILPASWLAQVHAASGLGRLVVAATLPAELLMQVRSLCQTNGGFLSILQAPRSLKQTIEVWGYPGNARDLMHQLKQQFDPDSVFSPHRMGI